MELVCPAGSFPALKAAVDNGADAVYIGFKDDTNARHFAGLNFNDKKALRALDYARERNVKLFVAINTYPQPEGWERWQRAVDIAADLKADAVIAADMGVLGYATEKHPELPLHLSVQGSATNYEALRFYQRQFNIRRAVLPRVLSMAQVRHVAEHSPVELEVFAFGSLCIMAEGRCHLSSYITDESPNTCGACSPAKAVRWEQKGEVLESRLNGVLIDRYSKGENAGYPTLCKGRFEVEQNTYNALEEPTSLNTIELIPQLVANQVKAVKIEGRQRSPAYVEQVVSVWRQALDAYAANPAGFQPRAEWMSVLANVSEGSQTTLGAYSRPWQ
ncbi:ubiquinone anaerobic biosynthesis protein UbiU [Aestuariirhabdus litorea]|uniref:Ubiquinone biosynthesis protein UbiU n=1 Tax=Aestuariirhabdus litorea TaxID=2528527 RepID=A0A3P3VL45_9GAMM|nr:peptidase U32 family protein [Aestuariirhabdus litorea]RRJ83400.1 U32 family peptidase [Aestuariirhabdus litorea]RWW93561.1 U32 family peptidase [Endozoicomonadaceae bacterium GTF-13]